MKKLVIAAAIVTAVLVSSAVWPPPVNSAETPPTTYELLINGESFLVEVNRVTKLESREKPGVRYDVALRVAPTQRVRLNSFQFQYDMPGRVDDDGRRPQRTVRLVHELGFTLLLTDFGQSLEDERRTEALKILIDSVSQSFRESQVDKLEVGKPHDRKFGAAAGRGVVIRYRDAQDFGHTCLVYLLTGTGFAATCVVQYLENDSDDVLPLVKKTLDSIEPIAAGVAKEPAAKGEKE